MFPFRECLHVHDVGVAARLSVCPPAGVSRLRHTGESLAVQLINNG